MGVHFSATGDESAMIVTSPSYLGHETEGTGIFVGSCRLDDLHYDVPPTYIKMDVEGVEPDALWGAREIIKKHSPILAITAYHEAEHLWTLPLLMHALQPEYKLFFRRYAEATFEIVWYAVPKNRIR